MDPGPLRSLGGVRGKKKNKVFLDRHIAVETGKCHEVDVHSIEDQLDGHEHDDDVAPGDYANHANDEERETQEQVIFYRNHRRARSFSSPLPQRRSWPRATIRKQSQTAADTIRKGCVPPFRSWAVNSPLQRPSAPATPGPASSRKTRTSGQPGRPTPARRQEPPTSAARTEFAAAPRPN